MARTPMVHQPVVVYTERHRIEGEVPLPEYGRLSDRLNQDREFLPVVNATVYSLQGLPLFTLDALMLNKAYVIMVHERAGVPAAAHG